MRLKRLTLAAAIVTSLTLTACANKQESGTLVGAVAGGAIGNQFGKGNGKVLATVAGALIGGVVGSEVGKSMDQQDRMLAQQAELAALERGQSGVSTPWRNPDNGRYGEVIPSKPYRRGPDDCRDYCCCGYV